MHSFSRTLTPAKLRKWLKNKAKRDCVGIGLTLDNCPIWNYLNETDSEKYQELDVTEEKIHWNSGPRVHTRSLPRWAQEFTETIDRYFENEEIFAIDALIILDQVLEHR